MADPVESLMKIWNSHIPDFPIPERWAPYLTIAAATIPALITMQLTIRRWRGDFRAVSSDLEAATKIINGETKDQLKAVSEQLAKTAGALESSLARRLDVITATLQLTNELETNQTNADKEIDDPEAVVAASKPAPQRGFRIPAAVSVRDVVMAKWLEGRTLQRSTSDPNTYYFNGFHAGRSYRVVLQTPYRVSFSLDGRLPFTLDVWMDGRKHLNFEWDSEGQYALRGFTKGDWIEDLSTWNVTPDLVESRAAA
jgi:hypothetical protein